MSYIGQILSSRFTGKRLDDVMSKEYKSRKLTLAILLPTLQMQTLQFQKAKDLPNITQLIIALIFFFLEGVTSLKFLFEFGCYIIFIIHQSLIPGCLKQFPSSKEGAVFHSYKRNIKSNSIHISEPWKCDWVTNLTEQIFPSTSITITKTITPGLSSQP